MRTYAVVATAEHGALSWDIAIDTDGESDGGYVAIVSSPDERGVAGRGEAILRGFESPGEALDGALEALEEDEHGG